MWVSKMKKSIILFLVVSICFGGSNLPSHFVKIKEVLQNRYQIYSLKDIHRFKESYKPIHRSATRDMENLVGDWMMEEELMELFVTVGSNQSILDPFSTLGLEEADGTVVATTNDFETDLNYLMFELFDDGGDYGYYGGYGDGDYGIYYPDIASPEECEEYAYDNGYEWDGIFCDAVYYGIESGCYLVGDDVFEWQDSDESLCDDYRSGPRDNHYGGNIEFESVASMNYSRYGAAYATDGDFAYAICGADYDTLEQATVYHTHGERYNPNNDSWELFGENLLQRRYTNAEYVDGNIYVFNGYNGSSASDTVEIIDTNTGEVTYSATNPYPVWYGGSAVWNDKIYIFGGGTDSEYSNRLYEFDPATESWTRLADMPEAINTNGVVVDGVLYTFGGYNGDVSSAIHAYDIYEDTWENVGLMTYPISANSVTTDGELIFVVGDYSDIEFCGVYDTYEYEFFELETNMEGRRHSSSVYMNGDVYAFGGSQPEGFNGNEDYVILSSAERGYFEWYDDDDDFTPDVIITNMNFVEFFMLMLGAEPNSLGVENPVVVGVTSTQTESGDIVLDEVFAMLSSDNEMFELVANSEEAMTSTSVDTVSSAFTFNNLSLYDSTGGAGATLILNGTIRPGMLDLLAGEETPFPFLEGLEDLFEDGEDSEFFLSLYDDSTGMQIEVNYYYDDEYYYGDFIYMDTSYFTWSATLDSLFLYSEYDDYYYGDEVDTNKLAYIITNDTLSVGGSNYLCEDEDSFEYCMEFLSEEIAGLDQLENIQSLRLYQGIVFTQGTFTAIEPEDGTLPDQFNLYANYPNPFNPVTTIRFDVGMNPGDKTTINIYDISGRNVAILINEKLQTGTYEVQWNAHGFSSGVYFAEFVSGLNRQTQKMILLK